MHRVLLIQEALHLIFCFLKSEAWGPEANRTLACLARTCRAFQDPALDVLWEHVFTLDTILRCLPTDALIKSDTTSGRGGPAQATGSWAYTNVC